MNHHRIAGDKVIAVLLQSYPEFITPKKIRQITDSKLSVVMGVLENLKARGKAEKKEKVKTFIKNGVKEYTSWRLTEKGYKEFKQLERYYNLLLENVTKKEK